MGKLCSGLFLFVQFFLIHKYNVYCKFDFYYMFLRATFFFFSYIFNYRNGFIKFCNIVLLFGRVHVMCLLDVHPIREWIFVAWTRFLNLLYDQLFIGNSLTLIITYLHISFLLDFIPPPLHKLENGVLMFLLDYMGKVRIVIVFV